MSRAFRHIQHVLELLIDYGLPATILLIVATSILALLWASPPGKNIRKNLKLTGTKVTPKAKYALDQWKKGFKNGLEKINEKYNDSEVKYLIKNAKPEVEKNDMGLYPCENTLFERYFNLWKEANGPTLFDKASSYLKIADEDYEEYDRKGKLGVLGLMFSGLLIIGDCMGSAVILVPLVAPFVGEQIQIYMAFIFASLITVFIVVFARSCAKFTRGWDVYKKAYKLYKEERKNFKKNNIAEPEPLEQTENRPKGIEDNDNDEKTEYGKKQPDYIRTINRLNPNSYKIYKKIPITPLSPLSPQYAYFFVIVVFAAILFGMHYHATEAEYASYARNIASEVQVEQTETEDGDNSNAHPLEVLIEQQRVERKALLDELGYVLVGSAYGSTIVFIIIIFCQTGIFFTFKRSFFAGVASQLAREIWDCSSEIKEKYEKEINHIKKQIEMDAEESFAKMREGLRQEKETLSYDLNDFSFEEYLVYKKHEESSKLRTKRE